MPLALELALDLAMQRFLVGLLLRRSLRLDRQEEVGPLAPGAVEKRALGVEGVGLDQDPLKIQITEQLPEHRPLMVFAGGVAGLADCHTPRAAE